MSLQAPKVFPATINSAASVSSSFDLGGAYLYVSVEIPASGTNPAFATAVGSPLWLQGSSDNVNFRRYYEVYTNAVATPFSIQSSVCNALVSVPYFNFRYARLEVSGTVTGAATGGVAYKIICSDSL